MLQIVFSFKTNHYKKKIIGEAKMVWTKAKREQILKVTLYLFGHLYQHAAQIM